MANGRYITVLVTIAVWHRTWSDQIFRMSQFLSRFRKLPGKWRVHLCALDRDSESSSGSGKSVLFFCFFFGISST
ncbi:hypothetical protein B0H14DRAFT_2898419 [Mycena olivaceomarginata]|nr:hypothetical protein B0H14DRAFT_2898419 [Mycena olivaceomarginata]